MEPAFLRRHGQRGVYDLESAKAVFDDCFMAHVSYVVDGLPACMPMIALIMNDPEEEEAKRQQGEPGINGHGEGQSDGSTTTAAVYLHGHPSAKLMELIRASEKAANELTQEVGHDTSHSSEAPSSGQVKVCITATKGVFHPGPIIFQLFFRHGSIWEEYTCHIV